MSATEFKYTCAMCGEECISGWSEEEALAEMKKNFGEGTTKENCIIVCDDCYSMLKGMLKGESQLDISIRKEDAQDEEHV